MTDAEAKRFQNQSDSYKYISSFPFSYVESNLPFKMLKNKFNDIFHNVQQNVSSHQKYRQILLKLYKEVKARTYL